MPKLVSRLVTVGGYLLLAFALPNQAIAAPANTANCNAALLTNGLVIGSNLNFGTLLPTTGGSATVTADLAGTLTTLGGVTPMLGTTPTAVSVTATTPGINGANQCTNKAINVVLSVTGGGLSGTGPLMGLALTSSVVTGGKWDYLTGPLYIGGTLTVGSSAAQTAGPYSGTINIDITFQ